MARIVTLLLFFCFLCIHPSLAQGPKMSPRTRLVLRALEREKDFAAILPNVAHRTHVNGVQYASALMKIIDSNQAGVALRNLEANIGTRAGNIWTVHFPVSKLPMLSTLAGISYIELDEPAVPHMFQARKKTRVDSVQAGINLPMRYSGKDVVVGIIDFGFDYTHPAMYDTTGSKYRIRQVWELNTTGTPPAGYTYGHEIVDSNAIKQQLTDNVEQMHGTCVAGIAAGSGFLHTGGNAYRGMAYESDMILVGVRRDTIGDQWMQGTFTDFIDGINYIFTRAAAMGKPAVINISWGSQSGPHNGSTLFNQACDNLSGPGKIIVMSAGNEGEERIHLSKNFTATDTTLRSYLTFTPTPYQRTWIDIWGEPGKSFCANTFLYSSNGGVGNSTPFFCLDDSLHETWLIGANGQDSCLLTYMGTQSAFNNQPRLTINVWNKTSDTVGFEVRSQDGLVHLWNEYYFYGYKYQYSSAFDSLNDASALRGNTQFTVSDMGSAQRVLLVGAYASKVNWADLQQNQYSYAGYVGNNNLVPFSSRGPMTDGRVKPDITAPGLTLATSVSSFDTAYKPGASRASYLVNGTYHNNDTFYYSEFIGTSASAPAASGIVALLLQFKPTLTPEELKDLLFATAIQDGFTGVLPPAGNNNWGHGKINAYGAMRRLIQQTGIYQFTGKKLNAVLYPNPNDGVFVLDLNADQVENLNVRVVDPMGREVHHYTWPVRPGTNSLDLDLSRLVTGYYSVIISGAQGAVHIGMVRR